MRRLWGQRPSPSHKCSPQHPPGPPARPGGRGAEPATHWASRVMIVKMGRLFMPPMQELRHMKLYRTVVQPIPTCGAERGASAQAAEGKGRGGPCAAGGQKGDLRSGLGWVRSLNSRGPVQKEASWALGCRSPERASASRRSPPPHSSLPGGPRKEPQRCGAGCTSRSNRRPAGFLPPGSGA